MDKYLIETLQQLFVAICKVNSRRKQKGQNNQKHSPNAGLRSNNQALGTKRSTKIHYDQDYTWCELVTRSVLLTVTLMNMKSAFTVLRA